MFFKKVKYFVLEEQERKRGRNISIIYNNVRNPYLVNVEDSELYKALRKQKYYMFDVDSEEPLMVLIIKRYDNGEYYITRREGLSVFIESLTDIDTFDYMIRCEIAKMLLIYSNPRTAADNFIMDISKEELEGLYFGFYDKNKVLRGLIPKSDGALYSMIHDLIPSTWIQEGSSIYLHPDYKNVLNAFPDYTLLIDSTIQGICEASVEERHITFLPYRKSCIPTALLERVEKIFWLAPEKMAKKYAATGLCIEHFSEEMRIRIQLEGLNL